MINNLNKKELKLIAGGGDDKKPPVELSGGGGCGGNGCNAQVNAHVKINDRVTVSPTVHVANGRVVGGGAGLQIRF